MRCINKNRSILADNSGETMVEVIVAFTLLSIMLLIFSQGISWAMSTEAKASNTRRNSDNAMKDLETRLANGQSNSNVIVGLGNDNPFNGRLKKGSFAYIGDDGRTYTYVYYESQ